ncbi:hypothetical protein HYQ45_003970 [Verticillium longisporum]|uniref:Uncharacterized protein n=1 Tax=Verticillium longisporum TaxID=100787 RepID=A0A8I2ZWS3_VERLO|nr:hypothetical protein HYQ45_003970 [Verticillium longisporum]
MSSRFHPVPQAPGARSLIPSLSPFPTPHCHHNFTTSTPPLDAAQAICSVQTSPGTRAVPRTRLNGHRVQDNIQPRNFPSSRKGPDSHDSCHNEPFHQAYRLRLGRSSSTTPSNSVHLKGVISCFQSKKQ